MAGSGIIQSSFVKFEREIINKCTTLQLQNWKKKILIDLTIIIGPSIPYKAKLAKRKRLVVQTLAGKLILHPTKLSSFVADQFPRQT